MINFKSNSEAKNDWLIIHQYGVEKFVMSQTDKYFESFFEYFDIIT